MPSPISAKAHSRAPRPPKTTAQKQTIFMQTEKQEEILRRVMQAVDQGAFITLTRLWKSLSYGQECSKQAVKCSVHILRDHGLLEFRYGPQLSATFIRGAAVSIKPTPACYQAFRPHSPLLGQHSLPGT